MAETDISLRVGFDTKDVVQNTNKLQSEMQKVFDKTSGKKLDNQMNSILTRMSKMNAEADKVKRTMSNMESAKLKEIADSADAAASKVREYTQKLEEAKQSGANEATISSLEAELAEWKELSNQVKAVQDEISQNGIQSYMERTSEEYVNQENKLLNLNNGISSLIAKVYEVAPALRNAFAGQNPIEALGTAVKQFGGLISQAGSKATQFGAQLYQVNPALGVITTGFGQIVKGAGKVISIFGRIGQVAGKAIGKVVKAVGKLAGAGIKKAISGIKSLGERIKDSFNSKRVSGFGSTFKQMLGALLGVQGLTALFNKLKGAIKEGIDNLAQWNNGNNKTNESISMLMSSLTQLKNSVGAAFAPILNVVAPILNEFIQLLISAANAVGAFFAKLGGSSTVVKATKVQQNYADSLSNTGKAADEALGKLGSYDELSVVGEDSSSGGGGGGLDPNSMFEEVPIDSSISDMVDKIKDAWEKADFTEIGGIVGQKTKDALDQASTFLQTVAQPFAAKLGKSIATFLNGFFSTPGLATSLGTAIGELLNTALTLVHSFLKAFDFREFGNFIGTSIGTAITTFDWNTLGESIALFINGFFSMLGGFAESWDAGEIATSIAGGINTAISETDWAQNAKDLSAFVISLLDTLVQIIEKTDWKEFGKSVAEFIANIDWAGLSSTVFEGMGAILGGLAAFLWGLIEDAWNDVVDWWYDVAYEDGEFTMEGLLDGIVEGLGDIWNWIVENIFNPFIDGFKKAFGINSPSTVMEEQGGYIVDGLLNPIKEMPGKVLEFFEQLKTKLQEKVEEIHDNTTKKFTDIKDSITQSITSMKNTVIDIFSKLWDGLKKPINGVLGGIESFANGVIGAMNSMIDALNKLSFDVPSWVPLIGGKKFNLNISKVSTVSIPRLAQGAVIPPNKEFMAVLGDQKSGTNIETPLDTMIEAFKTALTDMGMTSSNNQPIVLQLNGRQVAQAVWDENEKRYKQTGKSYAY